MIRTFAILTLALSALSASSQNTVVGDWSGEIEVLPTQSLTVVFHVTEADSGYAATLDSPDQGAFALPLSNVSFDGETFSADLAAAGASFNGAYEADSLRIVGTWMQGGREMPLTLMPYEAPAESGPATAEKPAAVKPGDWSGDWFGVMEMEGGGEVRLIFHLEKREDGVYTAVLDAPGQAENLSLGEIEVYGKEVVIDIMGQASFSGTVAADERTMDGTFAQGDTKAPMTLTRQ